MTKQEATEAMNKLEAEITAAFYGLRGEPSRLGHDFEVDTAIQRLTEAMMWLRRSIERKFA